MLPQERKALRRYAYSGGQSVCRKWFSFGTLLFLALLAAFPAWAQFEAGSVLGTVKDSTGAVIANAHVELTSVSTNATRTTTSDSNGEWDFPAVEPGKYTVTVKQTGLRDEVRALELAVGQKLQVDVAMSVGTATETVTVNASNLMLETTSSDVSNVRTNQQVRRSAAE